MSYRAGIATIHQEISLVPTMSVAHNLFPGREAVDKKIVLGTRLFTKEDVAAGGEPIS